MFVYIISKFSCVHVYVEFIAIVFKKEEREVNIQKKKFKTGIDICVCLHFFSCINIYDTSIIY